MEIFLHFCLINAYSSIFQDFCDGGAYPEIHVAQYPLGMGQTKTTSNAVPVQLDSSGKIKYDVLARQGHGKDKVSSHCGE